MPVISEQKSQTEPCLGLYLCLKVVIRTILAEINVKDYGESGVEWTFKRS
jgi:hypothetical protein